MSRHRLDHPRDPNVYCEFGHDALLGFFAETFKEGRSKPLAVLDIFALRRPVTLQHCFDFMIEHGLITKAALESALVYLQDGGRRPRSKGVARAVEIVMEMKRAAD